jgi:hypothetical protein
VRNPQAARPAAASRRALWLLLGALAVIVVLVAGIVGVLAYNAAQAVVQPGIVSSNFCKDLQAQRYDAAYGLLSPAFQARVSRAQFVGANQRADQANGPVTSCGGEARNPPTHVTLQFTGTLARFTAVYTRHRDFIGTITLVKLGSTWKIDRIDQSLLALP